MNQINTKNDGGPAFPIYQPDMILGDDAGPGLSLRDWFAGQAMCGFVAAQGIASSARATRKVAKGLGISEGVCIAGFAYEIANAMLKEREK